VESANLEAEYSVYVWQKSACCETQLMSSMLAATWQEEEYSAMTFSEIAVNKNKLTSSS
jgi:hypothetical protein